MPTGLTDWVLPRDPTAALHSATKQYVDAAASDAARQPGYPMSEYGIVASTTHIDNLAAAGTGVSVSTIEVYRVYVPAKTLITGACCIVKAAGTTPGSTNASGFALYLDDGTSRLAISTNDYTLFTSTGLRSKPFTASVAAQPTGRFLKVAMLHSCSGTAPTFGVTAAFGSAYFNAKVPSGTHRRGQFKTATTAFPATFDPETYGTLDSPMLFMGLY